MTPVPLLDLINEVADRCIVFVAWKKHLLIYGCRNSSSFGVPLFTCRQVRLEYLFVTFSSLQNAAKK